MERWHDSWNGTVAWTRHKTWYGHDIWNGHEALECTKLYTQAWKLVHPFSFLWRRDTRAMSALEISV